VIVVAVAVAALACAGVGIAAGLGAFEGTQAPPDITATFVQLNKMAESAVQQGFAAQWPKADVSKVHGVVEVQTADGPEDLWAAPSDQGGQCYFIDWANDPPGQDGSKYGIGGGCGPVPPPASSPPSAPPHISIGDVWIEGHPDLMTVYGTVNAPATTLQITLGDGSTVTVPVIEHFILDSLPRGTVLDKAVAFDASGNEVAQRTLSAP
jgi:hypothetical protein